jgi:phosphoglycerol transferase
LGIGLKNLLAAVKDWKNLAFAGSMLAVAAWVYSRVAMVNPAILGDEYLYSINARKVAPWDLSPAGDFSNYLFNFVYSSTNVCGDAFYTCGKLLNLVFFVSFLTVIFIIAKRYMNYWIAFSFTVLSGLSPLSVYTSMFLPESMYFFFLSLVLAFVLKAADTYQWKDWAVVGVLIGVTSLVKPHAWLSAIAIGIFLVVLGLTNAKHRFGPLLKAIGAISLGAILGRIVIGFLVAGPKALSFFGQYVGASTVTDLAGNAAPSEGSTPLSGAISLFGVQLNIHVLTVSALMGVFILGTLVGVAELFKTRELTKASALSLLAVIWLFTIVVQIVLFTGWITGAGDDHTTRVLERYYDFMFIIVPLAGLAALTSKFMSTTKIWIRLPLAVTMLIFITPAFSGFFGTLTIQIADAPNLAGLVVNQEVFNAAALFGFASLIVFAFFPRYTPLVLVGLLPVTMVGTGYQIQDQYQGFRGELNAQDKAGQYLRANLTPEQVDATWVAATSRFEATNVAIWADSATMRFDLYGAGSALDATLVPEGSQFVLVTGDLTYTGPVLESIPGEGYTLHRIK